MTTATETATPVLTQHPFERAGLGLAPFRCVGVERRVGPIKSVMRMPGGGLVECEVGSPGQPMGTCEYCGQGIADCYVITSADGARFIVGCDCVAKVARDDNRVTPLAAEVDHYKRLLRAQKAEADKSAKAAREGARITAATELLQSRPELLMDQPHPIHWRATKGDTRRVYVLWMLENAGRQGKLEVTREIEAAAKAPVDAAAQQAAEQARQQLATMAEAERVERERVVAEQAAAKAAEQARRALRQPLGTEGQRVRDLWVRVTYVRSFESDYGTRWLVRMETLDQLHTLVLWTSNLPELLVGRDRDDRPAMLLTGTVKKHETYEGEAQTVVQRVKLAEMGPVDIRP